MAGPTEIPFSIDEERHLITQLSQDDHTVQKTLQWLDGELRRKRFFTNSAQARLAVRLCVHRSSIKVKRWCLNVLSHLGLAGDFTVLDEVYGFAKNDPDILASMVQLIFREAKANVAKKLLETNGIEIEGIALIAASEHSLEHQKRLVTERIPLNGASSAELRSAIVLAGKAKAPPNLFLSNHSNDVALSELNLHENPTVVKYSLWALAELRLGFASLKLDISSYDSSPPEVRKWIIRLLISDPIALRQNIDLIKHAEQDESVEVREEAALELRHTYLIEASNSILHWYQNETNKLTKFALLDHLAAYSDRNEKYFKIIESVYTEAPMKSQLRQRIEASAAKTSVFGKLRQIEIMQESKSLFANDNDTGIFGMTINQTFNNSTIGAMSGHGAIHIQTQKVISGIRDDTLKVIFEKVLVFIQEQPESPLKAKGTALLNEAANDPKKPVLERLVNWIKLVRDGVDAGAALAGNAEGLISQLDNYAGLM